VFRPGLPGFAWIPIVLPIIVVENLPVVVVLKRFGFFGFMIALFVHVTFAQFPMTFPASAWYARYGYTGLAIVAATALYGFKVSLGGQPLVASANFGEVWRSLQDAIAQTRPKVG